LRNPDRHEDHDFNLIFQAAIFEADQEIEELAAERRKQRSPRRVKKHLAAIMDQRGYMSNMVSISNTDTKLILCKLFTLMSWAGGGKNTPTRTYTALRAR